MNRSIDLKVFGALRRYVPGGTVKLEVEPGMTVDALREKLRRDLGGNEAGFSDGGLLDSTAFANNERVLDNDEVIDGIAHISALPPVCGG